MEALNARLQEYLNNSLWQVMLLLGSIIVGLVIGRMAAFFMDTAAQQFGKRGQRPVLQVFLHCLSKPMILFLFVFSLSFGMTFLTLTDEIRDLVNKIMEVLRAVALGYVIYRLVDVPDFYLRKWAEGTASRLDDMLVPMIRKGMRIAIGVIVVIFIMQSVYGTERLSTLLAGLGVGGLAIALAAQDTVKNFFGSFMILVDKPFQIGDRVLFAGYDGIVEQVGFRTTRLRTLNGHLVTIPNSKISDSAIENIQRRPHVRRIMNITLTYDTPPEKVRRAINILNEILANHEGMSPDLPPRVHFSEFNDMSLNIAVLYWYHPADWWKYMEFSQKVNMRILDQFNAEGIEFAFPTQTLFLANDAKRQLALRMLNGECENVPGKV